MDGIAATLRRCGRGALDPQSSSGRSGRTAAARSKVALMQYEPLQHSRENRRRDEATTDRPTLLTVRRWRRRSVYQAGDAERRHVRRWRMKLRS